MCERELPLSSSRNSASNSSFVGSGSQLLVFEVADVGAFAAVDESPFFMLARTLWPRKTAQTVKSVITSMRKIILYT